MVFPRVYDLLRHLKTVHRVSDCEKYDMASCCSKVVKSAPVWPPFAPIASEEMMTAFTCGMAVRTGVIANSLLPHKKAARVRAPWKRKRTDESLECKPVLVDPPRSPHQPPPQKKAKGEGSLNAQRGMSSVNTLAAPMPSSSTPREAEYAAPPEKRKRGHRGGKAKRKGGVQPHRFSAASVNLNQPALRTNKVSQAKVAAAKSAGKKFQASQKQPAFSKEKQNFLTGGIDEVGQGFWRPYRSSPIDSYYCSS